MTRERLTELREAEARAAAKVVGVDQVEFLGYEDGLLEPTLEVREKIVRLIRRVRPEVVVTTDPTTRYFADRYINHPDHRAAGEATLAAVIPGSDTRLAYPELLDEGLEPVKLTGVWLMMNMEPNLVVDIGDFIDKKIESLACHVTQVGEEFGENAGFVRGWRSSRPPTSRSSTGRRSGCSGTTCRGSRRGPTRRRRSAKPDRPEPGSENDETDLDVALGGAGVGAAAVGLGDQGLGLVAGEVGNGHPELDVEGETAFGVLGQGDQGGDGGLAGVIFSIRATEWRGRCRSRRRSRRRTAARGWCPRRSRRPPSGG